MLPTLVVKMAHGEKMRNRGEGVGLQERILCKAIVFPPKSRAYGKTERPHWCILATIALQLIFHRTLQL
jgi:hypothetical protein